MLEILRRGWDLLGLPFGHVGQFAFVVLGVVGPLAGAAFIFLLFDRPVTKLLNRWIMPTPAKRELSASGV